LIWNQFIGITLLQHGLINPIGGSMTASLVVTGLLIASALFGKQLLAFLNVGLDDFRIAHPLVGKADPATPG
jgi:multiple antibiotic resistance protein